MGEASGITVDRTDLLQTQRQNRVGMDIGQHDKALLHQDFTCLEGPDRIGQQILGVGDDLHLDPVGKPHRPRHPGGSNRLVRRPRSPPYWQDMVALPVDLIQDGAFGAFRSIRRSATVTISQPDASSAAFISSALRYLPVPSIRRDRKVFPRSPRDPPS